MGKKVSNSVPGGQGVFSQAGEAEEDYLKMFVEASVLTALFIRVGRLCKLRPLLALLELNDKLLLSLTEGDRCEGAGSMNDLCEWYAECRGGMNVLRLVKQG